MIATWMCYGVVIGALLGAAAIAAERFAGQLGAPRRWIWATALGASLIVPLWSAVRPAVPVASAASAEGTRVARDTRSPMPFDFGAQVAELIDRAGATRGLGRLDSPLAYAWGGTALLFALVYTGGAWMLARRRRRWRESRLHGAPVLVAATTGPAVIGVLRPRIVVPEWAFALPVEEQELMVAHEGEHVRARDPMLLHAAALAVFAMPWNLAGWWMLRRLRLAVEVDCDARVLSTGRDAASYGALLLNVCARRSGFVPIGAPALLERTSSLARRIMAMHPRPSRFPRASAALSAGTALLLIVLACEAPSPELIAPDGRDVAPTQVYGKVAAADPAMPKLDVRAAVTKYFPDVARGDGGPTILFLIRNSSGEVVMTDRAPADGLLKRQREAGATEDGQVMRVEADTIEFRAQAARERVAVRPSGAPAMKMRRTQATGGRAVVGGLPLPSGVGALRPDEIDAVEVSKYGAGKVAPNAVSLILISLKPGARVPTAQ